MIYGIRAHQKAVCRGGGGGWGGRGGDGGGRRGEEGGSRVWVPGGGSDESERFQMIAFDYTVHTCACYKEPDIYKEFGQLIRNLDLV